MKQNDTTSAAQAAARKAAELRQRAESRAERPPARTAPLSLAASQMTLHELQVYQIELEMQNEELHRALTELEAVRERYSDLYDFAPVGYITVGERGMIQESNLTAATLLGAVRSALVRQPFRRFILKEDAGVYDRFLNHLLANGGPQACELRLAKEDGVVFWAHLHATAAADTGGRPVCRIVLSDISERKQADTYRDMSLHVLQMLNGPDGLRESIGRVLAFVKAQTDADAVGLRLQDGEDFPYFAQVGFAADFLRTENTLAERGADGGVCRDKDGNVSLECTCGLVISGKTDPAHPLFTRGGSFWTNDSAPLLALPPAQDHRHHPRNRCMHHGYASMALIPVRDKERIVGLLHLNGRRKGCFTLATVKILEDIAAHIGESLSRRRGDEKLNRSDEQFRTLAEAAPAGIYLCDPDGHCRYANPAWRGMAGLSAEEARGKGWVAGLHPDDRDRISASWQHMVESHGQWGLEYRFQTREGKVTWVYGTASPQYDDSGKIVQYVGINLDITESKRANEVQTFLAQTGSGPGDEPFFNALARYLAQSLGMDFVCIDRLEGDGLTARTVAVWCDGRFEDNVTYALKDTPCGDVVGKQVCCFPANVCQFFPRDQVLLDLRAESYVGVTLFGHAGNPVGLIAVIGRGPLANRPLAESVLKLVATRAAGEIERLDAEATQRENEAYVRAILDSLPIGIAVNSVAAAVKFNYLNDTFLRFYRTTRERLTDSDAFWNAVYEDPDFREDIKARVLADCASGDPSRMHWEDIPISREGSETRYISAMNTPIPDRPLMISAVWDVTERKRAEAELLKLQNLKSVGTLAGGIAHDFNNILLGVFGNISLALEDLPSAHPCSAFLREAERSMYRAMRLTKQLLTFAKGGDPVKEDVGLGALVEEVARFDLTGSPVSLDFRQADDLWPARADKGQLQQVISNLVLNARQAMPKGGRLQLALENANLLAEDVTGLRQGRYVRVTVRDEGTGIEPTLLSRIFDPYFTTKQTGSGLGLATVWSIINKHGGHIGVVSEVGKGTTFTFYLPASERRTQTAAKPAAETPDPISARAAKILVMDDEESVCRLVQIMLTRCGYTVATTPGGREAIALYRQALEAGEPFDVVIMDLTIPGGIGGIEAIQDLLAHDPNVRAIVSSGYAGDPVMANPASYGFKGTVAKPYTASALREAVALVLA